MKSKFNIWIDGYYARRILAGEHERKFDLLSFLPAPTISEMEIKSGYYEALNKNKVA